MQDEGNDAVLLAHNLLKITIVPGKRRLSPKVTGGAAPPKQGAKMPAPKLKDAYTMTIDYQYPWN